MSDSQFPPEEAFAGTVSEASEAPSPLRPVRRRAGPGEGRVPPQSLEAETAVLASMMLDNVAVATVVEFLVPDDFYRPAHRMICSGIYRLFERGEAVDIVTLSEELAKAGALEKVGGEIYLAELLDSTVSAANVEYHAGIVREKSVLRKMIDAARVIAEEAYASPEDVSEFLDRSEHKMFEIAEKGPRQSFVAIRDLLHDSFEKIEELYHNKRLVTGVPSGYLDLDTLLSGFQPSEFIVIAGRPSMGKTAFTLNVAQHVSVDQKLPVAFFSLEMSKESLVHRMLAAEARVDGNRLRTGFLKESEWPRLTTAAGKLGDAEFYIDDSAGTTALEIRAKSRRLMVETNNRLALIVIDYLQLIHGSRAENRQQEVSGISRSLKALAKELRVPVIALSQLKRPTDSKDIGRQPVLSDLRECVPGDTLVVLADGRRVPIRELVGSEPEVVAVDDRGRLTRARSDRVWKVGVRPVFTVKLASGRTIRATAEHRLLAAGGWTTVSKLREGDRLAIARRMPEPVAPEEWPDARVALLGQLIGDGSYLSGQPMRYTTASEENSRLVAEATRSEFGAEVKRYAGRRTWHQLLISGNGNRWHPAGVNAWLRELGVFGQRSHEKRVPGAAFRLANRQVALLLRHLWATDGCIYTRPPGQKAAHYVYFATASRGLAEDVSALLLRLGIHGRIRSVPQGRYRPSHHVVVSGAEQLRRFLEVVGTFGPRRQQGERLAKALVGVISNPNIDTLPRELSTGIRERMRELGMTRRDLAITRGVVSVGRLDFPVFSPSRQLLKQYAELLDDEQLRQHASSDLLWDRIVSIERTGEEGVYDITVPDTSSWLADGIVSHNSGSIEQDADVVVFIHRPEVFAPSPENEGIAEIVVGKQRNGPIGKVKLFFQKSYTRFENLARTRE